MHPQTTFKPPHRRGATLLAAVAIAIAGEATWATTDVVGEVTTLIGVGAIKPQDGAETPIQRGMNVRAGDLIKTGEGGHVHIRFIDGGLVSVRPKSRLQVESYQNATPQGQAAIKFRLEEGVIRSVTGRWGEANRDRFRLNTPVAAIGVKGTDFVVRVDAGNTYASVISGAIVMAPLDGSCAVTLGPCQGEGAVALTAEMQGKMIEFLQQNGGGTPRLVPATDLLARKDVRGEGLSQEKPTPSLNTSDTNEKARTGEVGSIAVAEGIVSSAGPATASRPMVWLHNVYGWNVAENTISERYEAAKAQGMKPAVGNFFITLYRDESNLTTFTPNAVQADFNLNAASAIYTQSGGGRPAENVQISGASLNVDFLRSNFSTRMSISSPSLGQDTFAASGKVNANGIFVASANSQSLGGSFNMDGTQAGYFFDKITANGKVSGLTLWGR